VVELKVRSIALFSLVVASAVAVSPAPIRAAGQTGRQQNVCYPAQATASYARRITISDSIAKLTAIVGRALNVCAAAAVDGATSDPSLYLTCYEIRSSAMSRRYAGYVSNPFGTARLILEAPRSVCVASSPTINPPDPLRLTCYAALGSTSSTSIAKTIRDPFGISRDSVASRLPVSLCASSRRYSPSPLYLACYSVASETTGRTVVLSDEWGTLRASLGQRDRLCIQSSFKRR
jgi:hypothetical protein